MIEHSLAVLIFEHGILISVFYTTLRQWSGAEARPRYTRYTLAKVHGDVRRMYFLSVGEGAIGKIREGGRVLLRLLRADKGVSIPIHHTPVLRHADLRTWRGGS